MSPAAVAKAADRVLSSNAYMLLYRRTSLPAELATNSSNVTLPSRSDLLR